MSDERLETRIRDRGIGTSSDTVTVEITATGRRKVDFEALRQAVKEVLDADE